MPPRPFPYPLSIGTDIAHVPRIQRILERPEPEGRPFKLYQFLRHLLTYREQQSFWCRFRSLSNVRGPGLPQAARYLAGRWAAKEAVIKAVHWRKLHFGHVQILHRQPGKAVGSPLYALILDERAAWTSHAVRHLTNTKPGGTVPRETDSHEANTLEHYDAGRGMDESSAQGPHHPTDNGNVTPPELQNDDPPGQIAQISISHDGEYATAVCLAAEEPSTGDVGGEAAAREP